MAPQTKRVRHRTGLSLRVVRVVGPSRNRDGLPIKQRSRLMTHQALVAEANSLPERRLDRRNAMTPEQLKAVEAICQQNEGSFFTDDEPNNWMDVDDMLDGTERLDISHGGMEFEDLVREITGVFVKPSLNPRRVDHRTRRDRILRRTELFKVYLNAMADSYMQWTWERASGESTREGDPTETRKCEWRGVVVDVFSTEKISLEVDTNTPLVAALLRQGFVPCAPEKPTVVITVNALEFYRVAHHRCPHFSIQAYVKTLCDLHGVAFKPYLSRQFSIAFDVYTQVRVSVDSMVTRALLRDGVDWRLRHCCPACTYTLEDEGLLRFKMLYSMDGNDSLKRVLRRVFDPNLDPDVLRPSSELPTGQTLAYDHYLSRNYVDKFSRDTSIHHPNSEEAELNPCAGRWHNMDPKKTNKFWGVYDETGIFIAVCRHGFVLLILDMVQSGELSKYPLAVVNKMMETFGANLGGGYDIGCQLATTIRNSPIGPQALELNHTCLVGAFHGHAHSRVCQLDHLATYIKGLGIEDLETCERTFSKSNALAAAVRHASVFHRQQAIAQYFEHNDQHEVYANLATFLVSNYRQALDLIDNAKDMLPKLMGDLGITNETVFEQWLDEERQYLHSLTHEPDDEVMEMEYLDKLVKLSASDRDLATVRASWSAQTGATSYTSNTRDTRKAETALRHALEKNEKLQQAVHDLEVRIPVHERWTPANQQWQRAAKLVVEREYRRALDNLEGLVVARLFELTKMNKAGTGYKLRKHIAKALQRRSAAIRSALDRYNATAAAMTPPRRKLEWDDVIEYTFLSDFELLRDVRQDISRFPWATPAGRHAMDIYFKRCRAEEEIVRLNIEIRRLLTYIRDEDHYLNMCALAIKTEDPALAHQVTIYRNIRARFHSSHLETLRKLLSVKGFTGTLSPGKSTQTARGESASLPTPHIHRPLSNPEVVCTTTDIITDMPEDLDEEQEDDEGMEEVLHALQDLLHFCDDDPAPPVDVV